MAAKIETPKLKFKDYLPLVGMLLSFAFQANTAGVIGLMVTFILLALQPILRTYILKVFIDVVVSGRQIETGETVLLLSLLGFSFIAGPLLANLEDYFNENVRDKLNKYIAKVFIEKFSSLDFPHFEDPKLYDLVEKVSSDVYFRPIFFLQQTMSGISELISIILNGFLVAQINPFLVPLIFVVSIPTYIANTKHDIQAYSIFNYRSPQFRKASYLKETLQDPWSAIELKIYNLSKYFADRYMKIHDEFIEQNKKIRTERLKDISLTSIIDQFGLVFSVAYLAFQTIGGVFSVGSFTFYYSSINKLNAASTNLLDKINKARDHAQYMYFFKKFLDLELALEYPENGVVMDPKKLHKIEFKNVWFRYPDTENWVFKDFSMTINPGEQIALVGENGVGKSTLIKLILRFFDPDRGQILIDGVDLRMLDIPSWYRNIGILFQEYTKYALSIKENIGFGDISNLGNLNKIRDAAKKATADKFINKYSKKYDQVVGKAFEDGVGLSGGQWQKLALARGFMRDASITILDEPTSSLDAKAESEIFNKLNKWLSKKTVIFVSHRFSTVKNADKIFVIDDGKIIESGNHQELLNEQGVYAKLYKLQADAYKD